MFKICKNNFKQNDFKIELEINQFYSVILTCLYKKRKTKKSEFVFFEAVKLTLLCQKVFQELKLKSTTASVSVQSENKNLSQLFQKWYIYSPE